MGTLEKLINENPANRKELEEDLAVIAQALETLARGNVICGSTNKERFFRLLKRACTPQKQSDDT